MTNRRLTALLLCAALVFTLPGCGRGRSGDGSAEGSADGGESSYAEGSVSEPVEEPAPQETEEEAKPFGLGYYEGLGFNPYTCDNAQNQSLMGLLYEPLFELDQSFTAKPCLAESITAKTRTAQRTVEVRQDNKQEKAEESEESQKKVQTRSVPVTEVTVSVREGARFSDGSKVRAEDVAYSLRRAAEKGSVYRSRLSGLRDLESSGKRKVKFTLDGGCASVAELLDVPIIKNGQGDKDYPIGSGPYVVKRDKKGRPVRLDANESWWRLGETYEVALSQGVQVEDSSGGEGLVTLSVGQPLPSIRLYRAGDSDELIFGFSSGAVTVVSSDLTSADALQYTGSFDVADYPTTVLLYLGCNTAKGPCAAQKLRAAVYQAVDRGILVERMLAGHAQEARLPVPPNSALYPTQLGEELAYSRETARKLGKEAKSGSTLKLIVNRDSPFKSAAAKEVARQLSAAGLETEAQVLSWKEYREALKAGSYDLYFGEVRLGANFDLAPLLDREGTLNFSGYHSDSLSAAEKKYRQAGRDTRAAAAQELFALLTEEAPFVPLCFKSQSVLSRSGVVSRQRASQSNLFYRFWEWVIDEKTLEASGRSAS